MKLTKKLLGITAIIAAVGFMILPLTGCPAEADDDGGRTTIVPDNGKTGDGDGTFITVATIEIDAPSKNAIPATTISQEQERFTAGTVTWSPNDNPFKGETIYTATVTLTAKSGYTFTGLTSANATINGNTTNLTNNTGKTVTLSYIFPATLNKAAGAAVNAPTLNSTSGGDSWNFIGSATINAVTANNGQSVEYGISTTNDASTVSEWQEGLTFNDLKTGLVDYQFIFARSKEDDNHLAGAASAGFPVTIPYVNNSVDFDRSWWDGFSSLPDNDPNDPYTIKMNLTSVGSPTSRVTLSKAIQNSKKYINLDLSDSTFTTLSMHFLDCTYLTGIILPASLTGITQGFFTGCTSLASITINGGSIGDYAFYGCTNLTSVTIGSGVTSIGEHAPFYLCKRLTAINVDPSNNTYSSQDGVVCNKTKTSIIYAPEGITGAIIIPNTVNSIENGAFQCCTSLTSVTIPNSVNSIGSAAFDECTNLTSVTIGSGVTSIGNWAFRDCTNLTSITFATGSNIPDANFGNDVSPEGSDGDGGNTLKTAYNAASPKAGTYTRAANGDTWSKQ
jgi:hypothetical protein